MFRSVFSLKQIRTVNVWHPDTIDYTMFFFGLSSHHIQRLIQLAFEMHTPVAQLIRGCSHIIWLNSQATRFPKRLPKIFQQLKKMLFMNVLAQIYSFDLIYIMAHILLRPILILGSDKSAALPSRLLISWRAVAIELNASRPHALGRHGRGFPYIG